MEISIVILEIKKRFEVSLFAFVSLLMILNKLYHKCPNEGFNQSDGMKKPLNLYLVPLESPLQFDFKILLRKY